MAEAKIVGVRTRKDGATFTNLDLSGIPDDSWQIVSFMWSNSAATVSMPAGWTVLFPVETTGTRRNMVFGRKRVAGDPTTATVTLSASAQIATTTLWGTGNWESRVIGSSRVRSTVGTAGSRTQNIAPSLAAPAKSLVIAITNEATNARTLADEISAVSPSSWARYSYLGQPDTTANNIETTGIYWNAFQNAGASGDVAFTYTSAQDNNGWAAQIAIPGDFVIAPGAPAGTLNFTSNIWADQVSMTLVGKTTGAQEVELLVNGQTFTATPDSAGYFRVVGTGLSPSSTYIWELRVDNVLRDSDTLVTLPGWNNSDINGMTFAWGSCFDAYTSAVFGLINARQPRFIAELGDWGYQYITGGANGNTSPTDVATVRAHREPVLAAAAPQGLFTKYPTSYTYSDCDGGGSNADSTVGGLATGAVQAAYRQQFAHPTLTLTNTGFRYWRIGRVLFIHTDETTAASARGSADNSSKTKLGAEQKTAFKDLITTASQQGWAVVWFGDGPWAVPASVGTHNDWSAYNTERTELGNYIQASGVKLVRLHGDTHALFADDGTNNPWGGFPYASAAPLHTTANPYNRPVSNGSWPTAQTGSSRQYGIGEFTDVNGNLTLTIHGYSSTNAAPTEVERFNMVMNLAESDASSQPWAKLYIGDMEASKLYIGDTQVWP
ncbi:phosphoesterase [Microbacterium phage A3Wally]|nr:phosphoesterase [Microbacterium phage A3Wally]